MIPRAQMVLAVIMVGLVIGGDQPSKFTAASGWVLVLLELFRQEIRR